ncbi:hypothetical protein V5O48_017216, partial [Marasmius crinis-equi]
MLNLSDTHSELKDASHLKSNGKEPLEGADLVLVNVWATGRVLLSMCRFLPKEIEGVSLIKEMGEALCAEEPSKRMALVERLR